jgi:hypothetical protein
VSGRSLALVAPRLEAHTDFEDELAASTAVNSANRPAGRRNANSVLVVKTVAKLDINLSWVVEVRPPERDTVVNQQVPIRHV